ncbi:undecaprenyl-phosphate glucose phosphotransferase [Pedobacter sp. MW01-1-1]|uniref:undecaprenyl-phosphate glucose phosphotransferase n=1 Tax=Pedobacter sp. MW01-1-1 TaxID=3383027 RepID=UPI003FEFDE4A
MAADYLWNLSKEFTRSEDRTTNPGQISTSLTDKYGSYYKGLATIIDLSLLNASGYLVSAIKHWGVHAIWINKVNLPHVLLVNFIWFYVTQNTKLYQDLFAKDSIPTIKQSFLSVLFFSLLLNLLIYFVPDFRTADGTILYTLAIFTPVFFMGKIVFLLLRRNQRANLIEYTKVVIVGAGPVGLSLAKLIDRQKTLGYQIVGFFDDREDLRKEGVTRLGSVNDCVNYVKKHNISEIYCALPEGAQDHIERLMRLADKEMIRFKLVPDVKNYFKKTVSVKMLGHLPVLSPREEPLENISNKIFKRIFDIVFSLLVIVFVMSWLLPLLAILIKLESKGPVFFKQLRSGKDNKPFYCLKFRSMRVNSDSDKLQAQKNDSRITKLGAFMRKTSIDELPQFFNVLVGDMSVIGPRPHMLQHTQEYSKIIDQFMVRHFLLPGITGWAQVSGFRGETREDGLMEARVEADIWYLENWSLLLDFKIAFLTVWQVIAGHKNAY